MCGHNCSSDLEELGANFELAANMLGKDMVDGRISWAAVEKLCFNTNFCAKFYAAQGQR